jgi:hypothetical protein
MKQEKAGGSLRSGLINRFLARVHFPEAGNWREGPKGKARFYREFQWNSR